MAFIITDDMEKMLSETAKMYGFDEKDQAFRNAFITGWQEGAKNTEQANQLDSGE